MRGFDLIAMDMDGTLLTSEKCILADTVRDIDAAGRAGKQMAFCTGRCVPELVPYLGQLHSIRYAVSMSGAAITDLLEGKSLYAVGVESSLVLEILAALEPVDVMVHLLTEKASYILSDQACRATDYHMAAYQELFSRVSQHPDNLKTVAAALEYVPKINLYFRHTEDCLAFRTYLEERGAPLAITFTEGSGLELSPPEVSKGNGLARLADILGTPMAKVVAVGDGDNDITMLKAAGLGVAMGNAAPAVKAVADELVADNDHNGVGEAIRRFLL